MLFFGMFSQFRGELELAEENFAPYQRYYVHIRTLTLVHEYTPALEHSAM
jgi:hypothetical protein